MLRRCFGLLESLAEGPGHGFDLLENFAEVLWIDFRLLSIDFRFPETFGEGPEQSFGFWETDFRFLETFGGGSEQSFGFWEPFWRVLEAVLASGEPF